MSRADETAPSSCPAQVHAATLRGGERVVLKVQHPGVADMMRADVSASRAPSGGPRARRAVARDDKAEGRPFRAF